MIRTAHPQTYRTSYARRAAQLERRWLRERRADVGPLGLWLVTLAVRAMRREAKV